MTTTFHAPYAHLPTGLAAQVRITIDEGRFTGIETGAAARPGDRQLPGVLLPGFANAHSHAFHRALRGRTHDEGGTFWTWRERMYAVAAQLEPATYLSLARAVYAEMALAGVTAVGEFHYLHHGPGGKRYLDPNAMGKALVKAAADAGIRLTLLDAIYLSGGLVNGEHLPLERAQLRFGDGEVTAWAMRVEDLRDATDGGPAHLRVGAAIHSVRAVPREHLGQVAAWARGELGGRDLLASGPADRFDPDPARSARPLHLHLSEQPAENDACLEAYGLTPTGLLEAEGVLGADVTVVHATHLSGADIAALGTHRCWACFCPTTERDLADGIGPAVSLQRAGARLSLGSDQHAVVDLIEEARALEMHERLASLERGRLAPDALLQAATAHESLGWPDAGRIEVGARADLVAIRLDTVRTAGADPAQILLVASASDVDTVVVDGTVVVQDGRHRLGDVGAMLSEAIEPLWRPAPDKPQPDGPHLDKIASVPTQGDLS
ncbi:MAG: formimidoylglutamate deiminase [Ornithinimicrobium sp.]|uniref:formimidoylglutamate deiminase n=1 Tax=Ornithinimicrobium sp. TaxID=1977084 RepID=UPI0026E03C46|nr:formimidoylglutamate deiminase [Ornithinimicrobium sp.]MDO5740918.1 formimidoylglutamate deiminase [Ornithinimicrobium sp.]